MNPNYVDPEQQNTSAPQMEDTQMMQSKSLVEFERSNDELEFGVENKSGHMNCFLNAALQLFWSLTLDQEREGLINFVKMPLQ